MEMKERSTIEERLQKIKHINWAAYDIEKVPNFNEKWKEPPTNTLKVLEGIGYGGSSIVRVSTRTPPSCHTVHILCITQICPM